MNVIILLRLLDTSFFLSKFNDATLPTSTILVLSTYSPFCWIVALVTILPRQITSVPGAPITSHISLFFYLLLPPHSWSHNFPLWNLARKGTTHLAWNEPGTKDISLKRQDDPCFTSFLWNITLKCKCTKANNFLGIVSSVLLHKQ